MSTEPTVGVKAELAARPTVIRGDGTVEDHSQSTPPLTPEVLPADPKLIALLKDIKANPGKYPNNVVFDKIMDIAKEDIKACAEAKLPQTAELYFNLIALAFSTVQKALLHLHGVTAVTQQTQAPAAERPLVSLS
jgi:hypothetical protein